VERSPQPETECSICKKPVALETANTDEDGNAVHEQCYVLKMVKRSAQMVVAQAEKGSSRHSSPRTTHGLGRED